MYARNVLHRRAHFTPTLPLSLYLHGAAGTGKSSLARLLPHVLQTVVAQYCCPSIHVHYVKETLNKPLAQLQLEWDVREFNNDRSILSIVHSRMMQSSSQRQNGLVVLALEEMAQDDGIMGIYWSDMDTGRTVLQEHAEVEVDEEEGGEEANDDQV